MNHEINQEKKNWTHKIPRKKKNFGAMKHSREKNLYPGNTHEKNVCTHEIPNRKSFGYTKYPRGKVSDSQNTQEDIMTRWH